MLAYLVRHMLFSYSTIFKRKVRRTYLRHAGTYFPSVTILIPARNEEAVIGRLLSRITELTYPKDRLQVIAIDDGSTDLTGFIMDVFARAYPYIEVIHREPGARPGGKPAALNAALPYARGEIIVVFDADYFPQVDIIEKLVAPFIDPEVGLVQGRVTVLNEPDTIVTRTVSLERIGGYVVDQTARDHLAFVPQYGGTVGAIRKDLLMELGGWDPTILAEDTDITFEAIIRGYKVRYLLDAECYEEAVRSWRDYMRQRYRWAKGHMQCMFKHFVNLWRSPFTTLREKIDGTLLLFLYFVPVCVGIGWILGLYMLFFQPPFWIYWAWPAAFTFAYSITGNFAPFFEAGCGLHLDRRTRSFWLLPLMIIPFTINVFLATKAFFDLLVERLKGKVPEWKPTVHVAAGTLPPSGSSPHS